MTNGHRVHEFLHEMNNKVLCKYDLLSVGEAPGATVEEAQKYAALDGSELSMVFQFEHMSVDDNEYGKWSKTKLQLPKLKKNLSKWQTGLQGKAWNSMEQSFLEQS